MAQLGITPHGAARRTWRWPFRLLDAHFSCWMLPLFHRRCDGEVRLVASPAARASSPVPAKADLPRTGRHAAQGRRRRRPWPGRTRHRRGSRPRRGAPGTCAARRGRRAPAAKMAPRGDAREAACARQQSSSRSTKLRQRSSRPPFLVSPSPDAKGDAFTELHGPRLHRPPGEPVPPDAEGDAFTELHGPRLHRRVRLASQRGHSATPRCVILKLEVGMSLLRQIQEDALDPSTSLATLLRRCKVLAVRLGHAPFLRSGWIKSSTGTPRKTSCLTTEGPACSRMDTLAACWVAS